MLWSTRCCYILKYMVSGKKIFKVSPKISMEAIDPRMWPVLTPRSLIGRIYVGTTTHYYILI